MPVNIDVGYFFLQLGLARYKREPYDEFRGWDDINLWNEILRVLCVNSIHQPTMDQLVQVFKEYRYAYGIDHTLSRVGDLDLRAKILMVFELKSDDIGVPFIPPNLERACIPIESQCNPIMYQSSSSDYSVGYDNTSGLEAFAMKVMARKELAKKYCNDALAIGVKASEMGQVLTKCPPDSIEYLVAESMPDNKMRRETFQSVLNTCLNDSSQSKKSSKSSKGSSSSNPSKRKKHIH